MFFSSSCFLFMHNKSNYYLLLSMHQGNFYLISQLFVVSVPSFCRGAAVTEFKMTLLKKERAISAYDVFTSLHCLNLYSIYTASQLVYGIINKFTLMFSVTLNCRKLKNQNTYQPQWKMAENLFYPDVTPTASLICFIFHLRFILHSFFC